MNQNQLYEFVYEKLKENLEKFELDMIHPDKDIMFSIDNENFRFHSNTGDPKTSIDYIWQIGIERHMFITKADPELREDNEKSFKEKWIKEIREVEDYMKFIGEEDFFNDGLNEFLMWTF